MRSQNRRASWLIAFAGAAAFLLGSFVVASFVTDRLRTAGAIALSGAYLYGVLNQVALDLPIEGDIPTSSPLVTARPPPWDLLDSDWIDRELTALVQVKAQEVLVILDAERGEGFVGVLPEDVQREEEVRSHDPRSDRPPPHRNVIPVAVRK